MRFDEKSYSNRVTNSTTSDEWRGYYAVRTEPNPDDYGDGDSAFRIDSGMV
ncbi:MAG TPA: hypothetical protein PKG48_08675 [Bacteroidales bacterium]|nr:hypothetical protein [Bacteroidales bacterium]